MRVNLFVLISMSCMIKSPSHHLVAYFFFFCVESENTIFCFLLAFALTILFNVELLFLCALISDRLFTLTLSRSMSFLRVSNVVAIE